MIRSLPRRAFGAYAAACEWFVIAVANRVGDPFDPGARVRRFHGGVSTLVNRYAGDGLYFEYDAWRHTYVVAADLPGSGADDYGVGHAAGKLAAVLGALPLLAAWVAIEVLGILAPRLPEHWLVGLATFAVVLYIALFAMSATHHWLLLTVELQDLDREVSES